MVWLNIFRPVSLVAALLCVSVTQAAVSPSPEITAQGFDMSAPQDGHLGGFGRTRVRFEVPGRIRELYIKERSYEVDLARTPEMTHFPLFGLKTQVARLTDVTLDFQNYINEKLEAEGVYTFELRVTDRTGKSASATLLVRVIPSPDEEQASDEAVETASFRFIRAGAVAAVSGSGDFGIKWKTIDSDEVVIEISAQGNGASKLVEMDLSDYEEVKTRKQLNQKFTSSHDTPALYLTAAGGRAAGSVFGVVNSGVRYLLKVTGSETSVSARGTTVTLVGEYKH